MTLTPFTKKLKTLGLTKNIYLYNNSTKFMKFCPVVPEICRGQVHGFMKFCPVVPEICRGQVHVQKKERRIKRSKNNKIIIRNGAKTISLPNFVWET